MRHILLATDFGDGSLAALKHAVSFAEENHARLTVVHVVDHRDAPLAPNEDAFQLLLSADLSLVSPPDLLVKSGAPAEIILELAAEMQSDLIVVGVHETPSGALSTRAAWPTLHRLLCEAQAPVLNIRG
jgi:nucleotide-binding universal stress UspA family protein